ncbi:MAG TPA: DNA replication and repair protein RecF [bacterium]|nr:DNA replication and repair protein RecF [bacterium]
MHLSLLRLLNFRNHRRTEITPGPGLNVVVGSNAQGKTSLLEAVELAGTGRSSRALREAEMVTFAEDWARVHVTTQRGERREDIDLVFRQELAAPTSGRVWREIRINGVPVRPAELYGRLLCVSSSPQDMDVVSGPPQFRRRLVDVLQAQLSPAYYYTAQRYTRALQQRNRLLRAGHATAAALEPWDEQVASLGAAITRRRRDLIARLSDPARAAYREISGGQERLDVAYAPNLTGTDESELVHAAREAFGTQRRAELARGLTLVGPHRDDVVLTVDEKPLRSYGSRGQQLAAALAVRLAERHVLRDETGEEPVLLLDDVIMALDERRQVQLLACARGAQVLLTVTTLATLPAMPSGSAMFRVTGGTVEAERAHLS